MSVESQNRATKKWQAKTYKKYSLMLRKEEDAELIAFIDEAKKEGVSIAQIMRDGFALLKGEIDD